MCKSQIQEYILCDSVYIKYTLTSNVPWLWRTKEESEMDSKVLWGIFGDDVNVLYLDHGDVFASV